LPGLNASLVFLRCRIFCFKEAQRSGVGRLFTRYRARRWMHCTFGCEAGEGSGSHIFGRSVGLEGAGTIELPRLSAVSPSPLRSLPCAPNQLHLNRTAGDSSPVDERSIICGRDAWTWTGKRAPQVLTGSISLAVCALLRLMKRPISGATFDGVARPGCIDCYFCRWLPSLRRG
jgi:hypothetical protein